MKRAFGTVLAVTLILGLLVSGISCGSEPKLPDTLPMYKFQTPPRNATHYSSVACVGSGGGYVSGLISNFTDEVRDYLIEVYSTASPLGYGSNSESVYQQRANAVTVRQVQPGESRTWKCKVFGYGPMYVFARSCIGRPFDRYYIYPFF